MIGRFTLVSVLVGTLLVGAMVQETLRLKYLQFIQLDAPDLDFAHYLQGGLPQQRDPG